MHELPTDLTNSLRSFRGSMYGNRPTRGNQDIDLERGPEYNGGRNNRRFDFDRALNTTASSLVLHPTKSTQGLRQQYDRQSLQDHDRPKQRAASQHDQQTRQNHDRPKQRAASQHHDAETRQSVQHDGEETDHEHQDDEKEADIGPSVYKKTYGKTKPAAITPVQIFGAPPVEDIDPAASRLAKDLTPLSDAAFYDLMGINPPSTAIHGRSSMKKLARHNGLFETIHNDYSWVKTKYHVFDIAAYTLLVLQLIISAVFIILGSLRGVDTHVAIAALGAVATVIAGVLALMQGQGLPTRLRRTRDSYENVLFEFEELYFDHISGNPILYKDVKKLREDYLRVLQSEKLNHPDTWTEAANNIEQGPKQTGTKGSGGNVMA